MSACNLSSFSGVMLMPGFTKICHLVRTLFKETYAWADTPLWFFPMNLLLMN